MDVLQIEIGVGNLKSKYFREDPKSLFTLIDFVMGRGESVG